MAYMQEFVAELRRQYNEAHDEEVFLRWVSEKVLESYKNGIKAGQNGAVVKRNGQSRGRGSFGKAE